MVLGDQLAANALRELVRLIETGKFRDAHGHDLAKSIPFSRAKALLELRDVLERRP